MNEKVLFALPVILSLAFVGYLLIELYWRRFQERRFKKAQAFLYQYYLTHCLQCDYPPPEHSDYQQPTEEENKRAIECLEIVRPYRFSGRADLDFLAHVERKLRS